MEYNKSDKNIVENGLFDGEKKSANDISACFYCGYDSVVFTWDCIREIGNPRYVQVLVNPEEKNMLLVSSGINEKDAFELPQEKDMEGKGYILEGPQILSRFVKLMNWENNTIYEVTGQLASEGVLLFKLNAAHEKIMDEASVGKGDTELSVEQLWAAIEKNSGKKFTTVTGVDFTYIVRNNGLYLNGRNRRISRTAAERVYKKVLSGQVYCCHDLNTFGETYLLAIFRQLSGKEPLRKREKA